LCLAAAVAYIGYLGFACYPANLSAIPYLEKLLPFLTEGWREQRDLYASIFDSKLGVFVRGHPMEITCGYGLIGLFLLLSRGYRDAGWEHCLLVLWYGLFIPILFFLGLIVGQGGIDIFQFCGGGESGTTGYYRMRANPISGLANAVGGLLIGVPAMLIGLVIALVLRAAVYVVPPLYALFWLFVLPSILWTLARSIISAPFLLWRFLHYVLVPHLAEAAYKTGMAQHLPTTQVADQVAEALCRDLGTMPRKRYPAAWKSRNREKRIRAFSDKVAAGSDFMEEVKRNIRLRDELNL
jgi:hypothetical protein